MTIFNTYTGNAMLNNALMTIEALGQLKNVSAINPKVLKELYISVGLKEINKRLKSYTMIFSQNNPLVNHAKKANNAGENTYHHLLNAIIDGYEQDGDKICEISGLRFKKTFEEFYKEEIDRQKTILIKNITDKKQLNKELKNIDNTDTSLNRTWFPLIGGLGSDAQALPQARFTVQIHPICIVILQFLPLSALLYKGGILLIDSSNFDLTRDMIRDNVQTLAEKIQLVSASEPIENIRDFSKGDYLLKALDILKNKEEYEETYSDLNMWSFSNSGTGASCEIDRVPNALIRKLQRMLKNPTISTELKGILSGNENSNRFLEALDSNKDWYLLYPNVFGIGKKKVDYKGCSPEFLEAYYLEIGKSGMLHTAKYIAGLIEKYKSVHLEKLLKKTDAWNEAEYKVELFKVLINATKNGDWSLEHQISILDNPDEMPIKNNYYQYQKLIHYYTQKKIQSNELPKVDISKTKVFDACKWMISLIQKDEKVNSIISNLKSSNDNQKVKFNRIILDAVPVNNIELEEVFEILYDEYFNFRKNGMIELLRIFYSQPTQEKFEFKSFKHNLAQYSILSEWIKKIQNFANDYRGYFYANNFNFETGIPAFQKFEKTISLLVQENDKFYTLINEVIYNTNQYIQECLQSNEDKWSIDELLTTPLGDRNHSICILAIKFLLKQTAIKPLNELLTNINKKNELWEK